MGQTVVVHQGVREVLQMSLRARMVELGDKSRLMWKMMDRMIALSTVSQSGVCQSLVIGEIFPHNSCPHHAPVEEAGGE